MTSKLKVEQIAHTNNVSAMTLNSNGTITPSQMVYASFKTAANTTNSAQELITNWVAMPSPATTLGASMTHSSGIFTFPHTGKYLIKANFHQNALKIYTLFPQYTQLSKNFP